MAGHIDHVIGAAQDEVVAIGVAHGPIKGAVDQAVGNALPIGVHKAGVIAPHGLHAARGQRTFQRQHAFFVRADQLFAGFVVQQLGVVAVHGQAGAAEFTGLLFHAVGQGEDGPAALGLPVVVDDGFAQAFADPLRGRLVQRLARQKQRAQAGQVVLAQERRVLLFEYAHRSGGAEHHSDAVLLHQLPPDAAVWARGQTLIQNGRHAANQRAVDDVAMPHHPADVAGAEIGLAGLGAKNMLHAGRQGHGITAGIALHALGLAGGAAGVQRVAGVGGLQPDAGNHRGGALFAQGAPQIIPPGDDVHGRKLAVCQQNRLRFVAGQRDGGVQQRLVGHHFAAARTGVGADDQRGLRVFNARSQRTRGKTAEHHRMDRPDAGAGQHGEHGVGNHRHVNQHPVAGAHAQQLHGGGHALHLVV